MSDSGRERLTEPLSPALWPSWRTTCVSDLACICAAATAAVADKRTREADGPPQAQARLSARSRPTSSRSAGLIGCRSVSPELPSCCARPTRRPAVCCQAVTAPCELEWLAHRQRAAAVCRRPPLLRQSRQCCRTSANLEKRHVFPWPGPTAARKLASCYVAAAGPWSTSSSEPTHHY